MLPGSSASKAASSSCAKLPAPSPALVLQGKGRPPCPSDILRLMGEADSEPGTLI